MCLGITGQIVEISDAAQLRAQVDVERVRREVSVALLAGRQALAAMHEQQLMP